MSHQHVVLVGNPNVGKSTLFNGLTGLNQKVGNFPGITVEKKVGKMNVGGFQATVVDLPGVYTLIPQQQATADERVTLDYLLNGQVDLVINQLDATALERHLYLTTQLAELDLPLVVVLTKLDVANRRGIKVDVGALQDKLGVPVLAVNATQPDSYLADLIRLLQHPAPAKQHVVYPDVIQQTLQSDSAVLSQIITLIDRQHRGESVIDDDIELSIASSRYSLCNQIARSVATDPETAKAQTTEKIDKVVMHPLAALPIFFGAMYLMFMFTIHIGGAFIDFFDIAVGALLVDGLGLVFEQLGMPEWIKVLLADGMGSGIQTVATFIPIVGCLYLFLTTLEQTGYLARAACVVDRLMNRLGLPGSAFVPMIMGFGCTVPAVMATRTLEKQSERVITSAMSHFMSCGARLPVFALFAAAFFPANGQNIVFLLYIIGICMAILTGLVLRSTLLKGTSSSFVLEMPSYEVPHLLPVLFKTWQKLKMFMFGAGRIIVVVVTILSVLNSLGTDGSFGNEDSENSVLSRIAQVITPAFAPMGIEEDNWQATVGIFTGIFAKEAVVGTLNSLYQADESDEAFSLSDSLQEAVHSIPENLSGLVDVVYDPLAIDVGDVSDLSAVAEEQEVSLSTFDKIRSGFNGGIGAFAYLLFVLMYIPCASAIGTFARELGGRWATFVGVWTSLLAYVSATGFYQVATFNAHPTQSAITLAIVVSVFVGFILFLRGSLAKKWFTGESAQAAYA